MTLPIAFLRTNGPASVGVDSPLSSVDLLRIGTPSQAVQTGTSVFEAIFLKQLESAFASDQPHKKVAVGATLEFESPTSITSKRTSDTDNSVIAINPLLASVVFEPQKPPMPAIDFDLLPSSNVDANQKQGIETTQSDEQTTVYSEASRVHSSTTATTEDGDSSFESAMSDRGVVANDSVTTESYVMPTLLNASQIAATAKLMTMSSLGIIPQAAGIAGSNVKLSTTSESTSSSETVSTATTSDQEKTELTAQELDSVRLENLVQRSNQRQYETTDLDALLVPASELVPFSKNSRKSLADELASSIRDNLDPDSMEGPMTLQFELDRPDLGRIKVQISIANEVVSIRITTGDSNSRHIISQEMDELRQSLTRNGLVCGPIVIESAAVQQHDARLTSSRMASSFTSQIRESAIGSTGTSSGPSRKLNFVV